MPASATIAKLKAEAQAEARKQIAKDKALADKRFAKVSDKPSVLKAPPITDAMRPTITGRKTKREFVMPDAAPKAAKKERKAAAPKKNRMSEEDICKKYKNAIEGTLKFEADLNKQTIEADLKCGHRARVATSDLFQVKSCPKCKSASQKEKLAELKKKSDKKPADAKLNGKAKKSSLKLVPKTGQPVFA